MNNERKRKRKKGEKNLTDLSLQIQDRLKTRVNKKSKKREYN